ncbi:hypothetical protein RFI_24610 [Reticulomyxa filosa]|uniref:Alpha-galactosidase n=1 Tax=Reticulomyxa filosa TaxID=46433 RepID=X6MI78_RETFI|nr:hypothetical protein RFI_24610 [Reticulomyxa filosa]|eukprot:ETO12765.1 hypothetical protein RFI_24610 [Reticulomyxa filosa]
MRPFLLYYMKQTGLLIFLIAQKKKQSLEKIKGSDKWSVKKLFIFLKQKEMDSWKILWLFSHLLYWFGESLNNGLGLTPPMGWSTWNYFARDWNASVFYQAVNVFVKMGLKEVGYEYINVDGGWWYHINNSIVRNASGFMTFDPVKYNISGYGTSIVDVINYVHSNGLKYGHYTDAGVSACDKDTPMSEYYETQVSAHNNFYFIIIIIDIALFVEWGMDMIKVDACYVQENETVIMQRWQKMLNATGRPVLLSDCRNGCMHDNSTNQFDL